MNDDDKKSSQLIVDSSQDEPESPDTTQEQAVEEPDVANVTEESKKPETEAQVKEDDAGQEDLKSGEGNPSEPSLPSEPPEPSQPESVQAADPEVESPASEQEETKAGELDKNPEVIKAEEKTPTEETREEVTEGETDIITSAKKDPKGAHWYVVHTYSGHEAKVAATLKQRIESQRLADRILEILVPTQEKIEIKEGKKNTIREKLFPGYILIKMILDDASWLAVRTTPGITSFVGNTNKPTPLPEAEVASIQRFMTMEAPKFKTTFSPGEAVKIVDGPFSDFLGSVSEIDEEKGKVKVLVSIFGRETPVELDFLQIAKL